jgi:hypothetical protein
MMALQSRAPSRAFPRLAAGTPLALSSSRPEKIPRVKEAQLALAIALITILTQVPAIAYAKDLDQRVPVSPGGLLQVDLDMGEDFLPERLSLDVRSHEADEVWAVADLSGPGGSAVSFRLEHDARGVRLYGRSGGLLAWLLGGPGVSVRVWIPREFSVDVRCRSGSVRIEEVRGSVRARVNEGSIEVRGTEGSLSLKIGSGPVGVTEMLGDVAIRSSEGPIDLEWIAGRVEARTGSGDIRARHMDGDVAIRTDQGEIEATELRGRTEARTERGAVYARFSGPPASRARRGAARRAYATRNRPVRRRNRRRAIARERPLPRSSERGRGGAPDLHEPRQHPRGQTLRD